MTIPQFEIAPVDVGLLPDGELRQLIAKLCRAEIVASGGSASAVTSGGHQDAADGGVDVRVSMPEDTPFVAGYIPRRSTILQVKATPMSQASVTNEMIVQGNLRPQIRVEIEQAGAYLIVCSADDPTDSRLEARRAAMRAAVAREDPEGRLAIDFLGREQIAAWANQHPSCQLWLLDQLGRNQSGWRHFDGWASWQNDWLHDDNPVVATPSSGVDEVSALRGLEEMRASLRTPGKCVRLAGLSGVGKTRFVQALFEPVGDLPLDQSRVLYADAGNPPLQPSPQQLIQACAASGWRGVIVVDDCNPTAHRQIESELRRSRAPVSVVTIEYDVADDEPEATAVFRLAGCSSQQLYSLLELRFGRALTIDDRQAICRVAGGNVRLAFAIGNGSDRSGSLAGLSDRELYKRLFHQRAGPDTELERTAQVASLVFSFSCELTDRGPDERGVLGGFIGQSVPVFSDNLRRLMERQLCQRRTQWRAVLPHALSNRLAADLLEALGAEQARRWIEGSSERLLNSFTKRLEHLHDSEEARAISRAWLGRGGLLGTEQEWTRLGVEWFARVAPLDMEATLDCLLARMEVGLDDRRTHAGYAASRVAQKTLHALAYEAALFPRAVRALAEIALRENEKENQDSARPGLVRLFWPNHSLTHATLRQKFEVLEVLAAGDDRSRDLAAECLLALTGAAHDRTFFDHAFGYRKRDRGAALQSEEALDAMQAQVHAFAEPWLRDGHPMAMSVRKRILALLKRFIQVRDRYADQRIAMLLQTSDSVFLGELHARSLEVMGRQDPCGEWLAIFGTLCNRTRPAGPVEDLLTYVNSEIWDRVPYRDHDDDRPYEDRQREAVEHVVALAAGIAADPELISTSVPVLVAATGRAFAIAAGQGLAIGSNGALDVWRRLLDASKNLGISIGESLPDVVLGFFRQAGNEDRAARRFLLDALSASALPGWWRVVLFAQVDWDDADLSELVQLVEDHGIEARFLRAWAYVPGLNGLSPQARGALLPALLAKSGGPRVALLLMDSFRWHCRESTMDSHDLATLETCLIAQDWSLSVNDYNENHRVSDILQFLAQTDGASAFFERFCAHLAAVLPAARQYLTSHDEFLIARIIQYAPVPTFSILIEPNSIWFSKARIGSDHRLEPYVEAFAGTDLKHLLAWADQDAQIRYPMIAEFAPMTPVADPESPESVIMAPWAAELLAAAPDKVAVLEQLGEHLILSSWSGSYAAAMTPRRHLIEALCGHTDPRVAAWADERLKRLDEEISWREGMFDRGERAAREAFE